MNNVKPAGNSQVLCVRDARGSTLTWVMVVSIVLTLFIATIGALIAYNHTTTVQNRTQTQAYYTAQTINERIVSWLSGAPGPDSTEIPSAYQDQFDFISSLKTASVEERYDEDDLGPDMGTADTRIEFSSAQYDELKITTTAEYAGDVVTLSTRMYLQKSSEISSVNFGFNFDDPGIAGALSEVSELPAWSSSTSTVWAKQYAFTSGSNWWSYFLNMKDDGTTQENLENGGLMDYRMDLLSVSSVDYDEGTKTLLHDYSYKYLQNAGFDLASTGKKLVRIDLNPSRGAFFITQTSGSIVEPGTSDNPYLTTHFPYNNTELRNGAVKGVFLTISSHGVGGQTYNLVNDKVVYYTLDHIGVRDDDWPHLTLGTYYSEGTQPPSSPLTYKNLSLYLTDTSQRTCEINSGLMVSSGTMYTKRSTKVGTIFSDSGNSNQTSLAAYSRSHNLEFETYNFVFADPGEGEDMRSSSIAGAAYYEENSAAPARTVVKNGSILIQNNHELSIGTGAQINTQDNKGIVIEPGGSLIIEAGADITGNIYVAQGARLTIKGFAFLTGNIYCAGTLTITSSFSLNPLDNNPENQDLGYVSNNPEHGNATGIFIYNDANIGVGTLDLVNNGQNIAISFTDMPASNKIHTFMPYPDYPTSLFCDHVDPFSTSHLCTSWDSNTFVWTQRLGSTQEEYN